jgi:hypothetical protein
MRKQTTAKPTSIRGRGYPQLGSRIDFQVGLRHAAAGIDESGGPLSGIDLAFRADFDLASAFDFALTATAGAATVVELDTVNLGQV